MFSQRRMDYTTVEQYLGRVRNVVEDLQCFFELVVVVVAYCLYPCLDLLVPSQHVARHSKQNWTFYLLQRHRRGVFESVLPLPTVKALLNIGCESALLSTSLA